MAHLPQALLEGKAAKANPILSQPLIVNGIWLKHVVAIPLSHILLEFLSVIIFIFLSHCRASFPLAFSGHEQSGLQQSQYVEAKPLPAKSLLI